MKHKLLVHYSYRVRIPNDAVSMVKSVLGEQYTERERGGKYEDSAKSFIKWIVDSCGMHPSLQAASMD